MFVRCVAAIFVSLFSGCVSGPLEKKSDNPIAKRLVGKSRTEILQCAGTPVREVPYGHGVIFRYYNKRPCSRNHDHF